MSRAVEEQPSSASASTTAARGALARCPARSSARRVCSAQSTSRVAMGARIGFASVAEVIRTPEERFEGLPGYEFEPHWFDAEGLRLHYVDEGQGDPVVCFHGEPTWAYLYRMMLPPLVDS